MFGGDQHGKAVPVHPEIALEMMKSENDFGSRSHSCRASGSSPPEQFGEDAP
ncbi:hypothetical protein [Rhodococcus sp. T2V]|uniref:hypothetical protein n=1 Tax=Rhodococcus sp. T2V TaxID=3034164 RepID=UPI0023E2D036|nr:hypothetical protein [Rhodococcus sp. T2V]